MAALPRVRVNGATGERMPTPGQQARWRERKARMMGSSVGYAGASHVMNELIGWMVRSGDADSQLLELPTLRDRSQDLFRNQPIVRGAINTHRLNTIGAGLKMQARIDNRMLGLTEEAASDLEEEIERQFPVWADDPRECDVEQTKTFADHQDLMMVTELIAGDAFVFMPQVMRRNSPFMMRLQAIDPARIDNPNGAPQSSRLSGGVVRDGNSAVTGYWIRQGHPQTSKFDEAMPQWRQVRRYLLSGRQQMFHLMRADGAGQSRGYPALSPIIHKLKQLDRYTDGELMAAVVGGFLSVALETQYGESVDPDAETLEAAETAGVDTDANLALGYGSFFELPPGVKPHTISTPGRPNQAFDGFVMSVFRQIAVAIELPFEVMVLHFQSSYSAARAALLQAWKAFACRRARVVRTLCQPVYTNFLWEAVASGRLDLPGFTTDPFMRAAWSGSAWIGPPPGSIDPAREVEAELDQNDGLIKPKSDISQQLTGNDWDTNIRRIAREQRIEARLGVASRRNPPQTIDPPVDETSQEE